MKPKSSENELTFWCSRLKISPAEFFKMPYADLEKKFYHWKSSQTLEELKNQKLEFIRNYAINNLRPRNRGGVDAFDFGCLLAMRNDLSTAGALEQAGMPGLAKLARENPTSTPRKPSTSQIQPGGCQGVLQAKVSLKDTKRGKKHNLDVVANTNIQGIDENQLMEILGTSKNADIRNVQLNRVQISVTEIGGNDTKEFNISRGSNGNLEVDCPNEWEHFVTTL